MNDLNGDFADLLDSPTSALSTSRVIPISSDTLDPRLKLLSYSGLLTKHACPRKFELYRKKATEDEADPLAATNQNVTFAFGHVVGDAIQNILDGWSEEKVLWQIFLGWHASIEDCNEKQKKNLWFAILAAQKFISLRSQGFLDDYELLIYNGKPCKELGFRIHLPSGFKFRGSVDAVLRHKITGKILVLEVKTSSGATLNATGYKNSSQAIGYSVVLDVVCPEINSYEVLYLVYMTKSMSFESLRFPKTYLQRAQWIQELLLDVREIELYHETGVFPMRGESCSDWGRDCEYLNQCTLRTDLITSPLVESAIHDPKEGQYDIEITLEELIQGQMNKVITLEELDVIESAALPQDGDQML